MSRCVYDSGVLRLWHTSTNRTTFNVLGRGGHVDESAFSGFFVFALQRQRGAKNCAKHNLKYIFWKQNVNRSQDLCTHLGTSAITMTVQPPRSVHYSERCCNPWNHEACCARKSWRIIFSHRFQTCQRASWWLRSFDITQWTRVPHDSSTETWNT